MDNPEPVITMQLTDSSNGHVTTIEVFMLNRGEHFYGFGSNKGPHVVGKTASLIVRRTSPFDQIDTEYDINDRDIWRKLFLMAACNEDLEVL